MTHAERVSAVAALGFTERQAAFLVLVTTLGIRPLKILNVRTGLCGSRSGPAGIVEGLLKQVRIPTELAGKWRPCSGKARLNKEKFVRTSMLRLQQQQMLLRSKLDRVYEDRLSDAIPEELWNSKSAALQDELRRGRTEMERHEVASQAYETAGLQILELAQTA
jgi:hypothetical protein